MEFSNNFHYKFKLFFYCLILLNLVFKETFSSSNFFIQEEFDPYEDSHDTHPHRRVRRSLPLPKNYSVHQPPPLFNGTNPVPIEFSILLFNIFDIKELAGEISFEVNVKLYWMDERLANWTGIIHPGQKYTVLNPSLITQIWHPDIFIDHMKGMSQPSLISKAASLRVYPDGSLRYSSRMNIMLSCSMDFYYYPADTQHCNIDMKSYGYSTQHITLGWKDQIGAKLAYHIDLHNFDVGLETAPDFLQQTKSAAYSGLRFTLFLRRKLSYHIIQTFIPSALFTIVSWLSFLVPPESTPGRMALCVTTLLTLTAMFSAVRQNTPSVSYIKALDLWMVSCIIFVFSVLAEYTVVLKLRSMPDKKPKPSKSIKMKDYIAGGDYGGGSGGISSATDKLVMEIPVVKDKKPKPSKYFQLACKIEMWAPRVMPCLFLLFNCFYWPYVLLVSDYFKMTQGIEMYYEV